MSGGSPALERDRTSGGCGSSRRAESPRQTGVTGSTGGGRPSASRGSAPAGLG